MTIELAVDLLQTLITQTLLVIAPMMAVAVTVGVGVSIVQTVTSIQDQTLAFVPKLLALAAVGIATSSWLVQNLMEFTTDYLTRLPQMAP